MSILPEGAGGGGGGESNTFIQDGYALSVYSSVKSRIPNAVYGAAEGYEIPYGAAMFDKSTSVTQWGADPSPAFKVWTCPSSGVYLINLRVAIDAVEGRAKLHTMRINNVMFMGFWDGISATPNSFDCFTYAGGYTNDGLRCGFNWIKYIEKDDTVDFRQARVYNTNPTNDYYYYLQIYQLYGDT